jgi:hypothetical protein
MTSNRTAPYCHSVLLCFIHVKLSRLEATCDVIPDKYFTRRMPSCLPQHVVYCVSYLHYLSMNEMMISTSHYNNSFRYRLLSVFLHSACRLLVTASVVPSSPILVTLMKKALSSSETSVLTRATRRNIPEDTILHSHRHKNLKSYILMDKFRSSFLTPTKGFVLQSTFMA